MSLILYKFFSALMIFSVSLIAVIYPLKKRANPSHHGLLELGDAFASGIFLGAALFHMLPDATFYFTQALGPINYPLAELFCALGFLLLIFLERFVNKSSSQHTSNHLPYIIAVIIILHAFIEGTVLGINNSLTATAVIFLAILAHKGSESFALAVTLNRSQLSLRHIVILITIFSLMTPLGIASGTALIAMTQDKFGLLLNAGFNAFAAGTFLYMSSLHHINHHHKAQDKEGMIEFFVLLAGITVMALLAIWS
jgi:solute carrier family 39 (zinc transporter), member 1/2/3